MRGQKVCGIVLKFLKFITNNKTKMNSHENGKRKSYCLRKSYMREIHLQAQGGINKSLRRVLEREGDTKDGKGGGYKRRKGREIQKTEREDTKTDSVKRVEGEYDCLKKSYLRGINLQEAGGIDKSSGRILYEKCKKKH